MGCCGDIFLYIIVDNNLHGDLYVALLLASQIVFICALSGQDRDVIDGADLGLKLGDPFSMTVN
jgi:hypothetical protein